MFPWIPVDVMNAYVADACIRDDDTNSPKENVPPPLPVFYTKIYPIVVPNIIIYVNTSHFVIVFVDVVHACHDCGILHFNQRLTKI